jgi:hypothetical protein
MNAHVHEHRDGRVALGLLVGTVVGAGVALWFAHRVSDRWQRTTDSRILRDDLAEADAIERAADDGAPQPVASMSRE